jgi:thioredoxin-dependent peroxiredoxin
MAKSFSHYTGLALGLFGPGTAADKTPQPGDTAPAVEGTDQDGNLWKLSDRLGRKLVLLYFYPKDDTPGCTTEACDFTAGLAAFEGMDGIIYGISRDSTESHRKFIAKHKLAVGLLSDPEHKMMDKYGAWGTKNMYGKVTEGVIRSTVLIDPQGRVAFRWPNVRAAGHAEKVREKLKELRG